ncbi:hypothetical protein Y032_0236g3218 [Ancylostoma ceylanicum]|uniref:Uncharacterized protein n=1 Tax=Ancylostoma ceylanicum TaxID=53326 RepID=A0A016SFE9_9BILA|nr:hypothetical protein Y032_0236g3218 [Ancylostoma ceylanicum]
MADESSVIHGIGNASEPVRIEQELLKTTGFGSADRRLRKAPEHESTEWGWVHHASLVTETTEYGSPMEDGSTVAQWYWERQNTDPKMEAGSPMAKLDLKRNHTCPLSPRSGENDRIRRMGTPWPRSKGNSRVPVRPGQEVVETPGYGSVLAKQW